MTLGMALSWAGIIRAQNGDLPGALAALQEAMAQRHAEGNRLFLGMTLQIAAAVVARLGQAEPAAVWPEPSRRISRRTSLPSTKTSGWGSAKPSPSPAVRSARPPTAPRSPGAPR